MKSLLWNLLRGLPSRIFRPLTPSLRLWDGCVIDTAPLVHPHWWGEFGNTVLQFKICTFAKRNPLCTNKKESNLSSQSKAHQSPLLPGQLLKQVNSWARKTKLPREAPGREAGPKRGTSAWRPALSPAPRVRVLTQFINLCKLTTKKIQCHSYGK